MSFAAKPIVKPMSMATKGCQISVPSLVKPSKASYSNNPYSSIPFKPIKLKLSCSKSYSISLPHVLSVKKKEPIFRVCVIAPQQEEDHPVIVEEQDVDGNYNWNVSENEGGGKGVVEPSQEAKVYVGYLPYDVDSEQLAKLFEEAGVVENAEIVYNRETGQSRGFGFVTMSTVEEAEKAMEMFHHYDVNGRLLVVNKASRKGSRAERPPRVSKPTYRMYVGNLPWSANDSQLEQLFSEYGKVVSAHVLSERDTGRSRGFGFVVMSSESEMNDAIDNLDGQSVDGRSIKVNVAAERQPRRNF